ncbi:putative plant self-incompatibility S1 [Medicago truncatula]|uniref:S-protein homolog n=1 Tax=Medicago truncatula TaxID=3880 RepID=G7KP60_MEDTR|nr:leguminosin group486 secreted peptide [Medicago truncatula]RHN50692.1 putative plant self-incompatibility S1 [Medicago truncatula]
MSLFTQSLLLLCVLTFSKQNVLGVHQVNVHNTLEGNLDMTLHCQSGDDDLGVHLLDPYEHFGWHFNISLFYTTLFYCSVKWNDELHHFDAFIANYRDRHRFVLDWYIKKEQPCVVSIGGKDGCYPWK